MSDMGRSSVRPRPAIGRADGALVSGAPRQRPGRRQHLRRRAQIGEATRPAVASA